MLPVLHQELLHDMSSTSQGINPTKVSGSRRRDHLDMSMFDTRYNTLAILESWSGIVVEKRGAVAPTRSVPHLARFLMDNVKWLTAQPPAADLADEIEGLHVELLRAGSPEPDDHNALTMKCVVENCPGTINTSPRNTRSSLSCTSGHSWEMREWLTLRHLGIGTKRNIA